MSDLVLQEKRSHTLILTLNRPDKRNALSRQFIADLTTAFKNSQDDPSVRAVILRANGPVFSAGMDLAELQESLNRKSPGVWEDALKLAQLYDLIYSLSKPTIAAIQGPAVAGGAGLVTVCDMALAVPEATLGYPEVRRGLVAAMVMPHLLRHVGERMARFLLLTGSTIDAMEAHRNGLINQIVMPDLLMERAEMLARACAEGGPQAIAQSKVLLKSFSRQALGVEKAAQASAEPRLTEECQEGLRAFFAKGTPPWMTAALGKS